MRADGRTERHDEAKIPFRNFVKGPKNLKILKLYKLYNIKRQILD
jgi:hypothetical protein